MLEHEEDWRLLQMVLLFGIVNARTEYLGIKRGKEKNVCFVTDFAQQ